MANLIETATQAGSFQTLVKALETADVIDILSTPGPYTIFAPTDEAFTQLPHQELENLLHNQEKLKRVLLYHVLFGDVRTDNLYELNIARTVEGSIVGIDTSEGIMVNDAHVVTADILTDNGVIHIIDQVLMPALVAQE